MSMVEDRAVASAGTSWAARCIGTAIVCTVVPIIGVSCGGSNGNSDQPSAGASSNATAHAVAPADSSARPSGRRKILFVGTSITAGLGLEPDSAYPHMIDRKLDSMRLPYDAVNAGVSGETSAGLLRRIDWLLREPFDVVVLETGANDGLRGASVDGPREHPANSRSDQIRAAGCGDSSRPDGSSAKLR
jgi:acyl-CoA thioesterase I